MRNETFHGDGLKKDSFLVYVVKFLWNLAGRCGSFSGKGERLGYENSRFGVWVQPLVTIFYSFVSQSSQVKRTPQHSINKFIIQKLNPSVVVDFGFISALLHA